MARRYALIVGISEYQSPLKLLSKPAGDAEAVAAVLKQFGNFQEVTVLKGSVNSTTLIQTFRTLLREQATRNDVLIYFTGHGIPVVDLVTGQPKAYLATSDTVITLEGKQVVEARRAVPLDSLNHLMQESQLSSLVMLLDCCHSGDFLERSLVEKTFTSFSIHKDYYLITACRGFEQAYAKKSQQHSIFTKALLEGLAEQQADQDGVVTGDQLATFIKRELRGSGQEPVSMGIGGTITLIRYRSQAITRPIDETCPYQGLQPFTEATQQFFFGRESVLAALSQKLEDANFIALIGASGSGKSSVVRAGLMPRLKQAGWRVLEPIKPGFEPVGELKRAFASLFRRRDDIQQVYQAIEHGTLTPVLDRLPGTERVLLVVDQFEEVFTVCGDEQEPERQSFITSLTEMVGERLAIVITMRADFLEPCLRYANLTERLQQHTILMPDMKLVELQAVIVKPAQQQGYEIEPALLSLMQRDVAQERNCLPLLQFALQSLWEPATRTGHRLTLEQYEQLGGLVGALNRYADRVYHYQDWRESQSSQLRNTQEQTWIKRVCLKLVRTGEGTRDTRQRQPKADLLALAGEDEISKMTLEAVLADLVDGRLLVTDQEELTENSIESMIAPAFVDLAHEALMEGWQRFAEWRRENRELRRLVDRMEDARREWEHQNKNVDFLLSKGLLAQVKLQEISLKPYFTTPLHEFYTLSKNYEQHQSDALEWAKIEAALTARVMEAKSLFTTRPMEGLLKIFELLESNLQEREEPIASIQVGLRLAIEQCCEQNCLQGHQDSVTRVVCHPDGTVIASGSKDGTIKLWNLEGQLIREFYNGLRHNPVTALEFSPDGQMLACSGDRIFWIYDLHGNPVGDSFKGHWDLINCLSFSPNGQFITSGSLDRTVRLWNLNGHLIGQPFRGHPRSVLSVHFTPDGQTIVSSDIDGTILVWNLEGRLIRQPVQTNRTSIRAIGFSPDGQRVATGGDDCTVHLWNLEGSPIREPLRGHTDAIQWIGFSQDGNLIFSGSRDKTIRLWDLKGNLDGQTFLGHEDAVCSGAISPDGKMLISGSQDKTIRLWSLNDSPTKKGFQGHKDAVCSGIVSPDGKALISGNNDITWQVLLNICCHRIRHHPYFTNPQTQEAQAACEVCQKYVWGRESI